MINTTDFIPSIEILFPKKNTDIYFIFCNNEILVKEIKDKIVIPTAKDLEGLTLHNLQYIGGKNEQNYFCAELLENTILSNNLYFDNLRTLINELEEDMFWLAGRAVQIVNWNNDHKYCGKCGNLTENFEAERAKKCPKCGSISYPRISPAIIVAVIRDEKLLLAHNNHFAKDFYSVIAGFVEAGETFEECVAREVREEVGINVKNIKYFGSQPWPFPNSLMIGFIAEYADGEIQVDGKEIGHADWYDSTSLPFVPSSVSIASELVKWFSANF